MRLLLAFTVLMFNIFFAFAQSNFDRGFKEGWKKGYCYQDPACFAPPSPPPLMGVYDNYNNYKDSYSRGFQMGLDSARSEGRRTAHSASTSVGPTEPINADFGEIIAEHSMSTSRNQTVYRAKKQKTSKPAKKKTSYITLTIKATKLYAIGNTDIVVRILKKEEKIYVLDDDQSKQIRIRTMDGRYGYVRSKHLY